MSRLHDVLRRASLRRIVVNVTWLFSDKIIRMGVGLFVGVWLARYLGPSDFGLLSFATALVGLATTIATLGLPHVAVRDLVRDTPRAAETLGATAVLHLFAGMLAFSLLAIVILFLRPDDPRAQTVVLITGGVLLLRASQVAVYWFEARVASRSVVWVQSSAFLAVAATKAVAILSGASLVVFAWLILIEAMLASLGLLLLLHHRGVPLPSLRAPSRRISTLLKESWPLALSGVAVVVYMKIDQVMLAQMVDDTSVGIYASAVRLSDAWYFVPVAIVASVFPAILNAKARSSTEYNARFQLLFDGLALLAVLIAIPMTVAATPIVTMLYGAAYVSAGPVLAVHIWASLFVFVGVAGGRWYVAEGRQMLALQRTVLGAFTNIALNLLLIPTYGPLGAAFATIASQMVASLFGDLLSPYTRQLFSMKASSLTLIGPIIRLMRALNQHDIER